MEPVEVASNAEVVHQMRSRDRDGLDLGYLLVLAVTAIAFSVCGDRDRGGAYAAAAGGSGGMIAGGVVPGLGVDAVDAVEGCCCIARVDKDAFAAAG